MAGSDDPTSVIEEGGSGSSSVAWDNVKAFLIGLIGAPYADRIWRDIVTLLFRVREERRNSKLHDRSVAAELTSRLLDEIERHITPKA